VLDRIAAYCSAAGLGPGDRLPAERELAERLAVGRSTVREALKRWETLGIVEMRKGSGTYLRMPLEQDDIHLPLTLRLKRDGLLKTLEIRRALEAEAAAVAATRATAEDIARIEEKLERMEAVHRLQGSAGPEDWEFHLSIYEATGNPLFGQLVAIMYDAFHSFFTNPLQQPGFAGRSFPLHRELFEAIRRRDPETARAKVLAILAIVEEDVKSVGHDG
jgi:DNA-binding FadR family transcriptional regulator